jgi:hypothetical protein
VSSWRGGTGLEGNSCGNPVMSHGLKGPDKLLIRPTRVARPVLTAPGDMSLAGHAKGGQACKESPGATRHQPWPVLAEMPGTDMPRLIGMQEVRSSNPLSSAKVRENSRTADQAS